MSKRVILIAAILAAPISAADWPQWRGPDRSNVSKETGLLKEWPKDGPPLAWKAADIGHGVPSISVSDGKVFVLGYRDDSEYLTALGETDGKKIWSAPVGPAVKESSVMRYLSQRTPTVNGDRVFALTARGVLICFATKDGKELWRCDYVKDLEGKPGQWGYCDFPLVDGDRIICTPGAKDSAIVALEKKTGKVVWKCSIPSSTRSTYGGIIAAKIGGVRQYVHQLEHGVVGVSAADGKLLWEFAKFGDYRGNVHTAIVNGDQIFVSCGWGVGGAILEVANAEGKFSVKEIHRTRAAFDPWMGSSCHIGNYVHTANGEAVDWKSGTVVAQREPTIGRGRVTMTAADGRLIHRTGTGDATLTEISPEGTYSRKGLFKPESASKEPTWTTPVVANGRLYLRNFDSLLAYDLRDPDERKRKIPDGGIFVPTPPDVVTKMLELAEVRKTDLLYDLGSGDGRIVIAAAKLGCTAVGVEWDKELVAQSRENARKAKVEELATFEHGDLFEADCSKANVVAVYLLPTLLKRLVARFNKLPPGTRIVSHAFAIPGIKVSRVIEVTSEEDDVQRKLFLYTVPLVEVK